jgi:predicted transcriptional regulator of viral defense system
MDIENRLINEYGYDNPIFINDIEDRTMSYANIRQILSRLVKRGVMKRFAQGVYYFPRNTVLGSSRLDALKVYEKRYISDGNDIYGFYSGLTFKNQIGLTTQMPNVVEIVTNNESSRIREIMVGRQKVRLRGSAMNITKENAAALQLLDFLNREDVSQFTAGKRKQLFSFIRRKKIKRSVIMDSLPSYPAKASKNLLESGAYNELI